MIDSIVNAPVWVQTPVVLIVLLAVCSVVAYGLQFLLFTIAPSTAEEREAFGISSDGPTATLQAFSTDDPVDIKADTIADHEADHPEEESRSE
ncbi:hypothetical protein CFAL_03460 [Corynebacterium falsenii DSM 44353]|uniref:hypothetical protein n=1 Tax=Corynebacterium falsenii TaxID=108486 RepID=UPI0003E95741|nr:hypothetical protein [Corynebacterium falsenii]AHI02774.1 hypothetical protein CFAL_03460 [Corynebacterium falsenii DSM 44353]MDC7103791.1 hypothetical protein [Corynebacterium falsenii]UBI05560.1 hypothetical protein LA343_05385 [Corynebacterium falsenii]UBI06457.1 hypothetical protein LA329_09325 [Corynebacterium falsenii]